MNYQNLKCSELKDLLAKRGLPSHGKKNELLERLMKHEEEEKEKAKSKAVNSEFYINKSKTVTEDKNKKNVEKKSNEVTSNKNEKDNNNKNTKSHEEELLKSNKVEQSTVLKTKEDLNKDISKTLTTDLKNKSNTFSKQNIVYKNENSDNILQNKQGNKTEENNKSNNEKEEKTNIPKITFSESSLSPKSKIERNIVTIGGNNNLTESEKRELRKKRFGIVTKDEILESRAKRFSIVTKKMEDENKRKRAERFGVNLSGLNDPETKKRRAERFGLFPEIQPSKMQERKVRFHLS